MAWGEGGGFPNLKEMIASDVGSGAVFFNENDFGERHEINGQCVVCTVANIAEEKFQRQSVGRTVGLNAKDVERTISRTWTTRVQITARASDLDCVCGGRPGNGYKFILDRARKLTVSECVEDHGVYAIIAEENKL